MRSVENNCWQNGCAALIIINYWRGHFAHRENNVTYTLIPKTIRMRFARNCFTYIIDFQRKVIEKYTKSTYLEEIRQVVQVKKIYNVNLNANMHPRGDEFA